MKFKVLIECKMTQLVDRAGLYFCFVYYTDENLFQGITLKKNIS